MQVRRDLRRRRRRSGGHELPVVFLPRGGHPSDESKNLLVVHSARALTGGRGGIVFEARARAAETKDSDLGNESRVNSVGLARERP